MLNPNQDRRALDAHASASASALARTVRSQVASTTCCRRLAFTLLRAGLWPGLKPLGD